MPCQNQAILNMVPLLDLTSLNADDDEKSIITLCQKAQTPFGDVASVCVYPKFVKLAISTLKKTAIKIDTVVNFPNGDGTLLDTLHEIETVLAEGADEIDMVFPYHAYLQGEQTKALEFIIKAKMLCSHPLKLKVIIETGQLPSPELIKTITQDVIQAGADFIKTSTGKTKQGATLEAARIILTTLKDEANRHVGLKISGGIRTVSQSLSYIKLAREMMGDKWVCPTVFRIGTSQLLEEIQRMFI
ncbi:MAG: deoC [Gammaproteobacteria bacterium]|jgi:deoxyribose-phosphate aldolase|nr:deoC [Gammaproteobacteria bacterium]MCE3238470.1 deoC [Gammaproteobacteria bacterium]